MNNITYISIKEVNGIINKCPKSVQQKIKCAVRTPSPFRRVTAANEFFSQAPVIKCFCGPDSKKYGIAIHFGSQGPVRTMAFCPTCENIFIPQFDQLPFIKEGKDEHPATIPKETKELIPG